MCGTTQHSTACLALLFRLAFPLQFSTTSKYVRLDGIRSGGVFFVLQDSFTAVPGHIPHTRDKSWLQPGLVSCFGQSHLCHFSSDPKKFRSFIYFFYFFLVEQYFLFIITKCTFIINLNLVCSLLLLVNFFVQLKLQLFFSHQQLMK